MPQYNVQHRYRSYRDGQQFGPWQAGETVELDVADAEWVNRDSEGCLAPVEAAEEKPGGRQQTKAADRQHRGGSNRGS